MKLSPDSPELTAYALGELPPAERAAVEAALADRPELRAELAALRETADLLAAEFATEPAVELSPAQRAAIVANAATAGFAGAAPAEAKPARPASTISLWDRFLAWRASLVWAAATVMAVAVLAGMFLPAVSKAQKRQYSQLRYQPDRRPEPASAPAAVQNAPGSTTAAAGRELDEVGKGKKDVTLALGVLPAGPMPVSELNSGRLEVGQTYDLKDRARAQAVPSGNSLNKQFGAQLPQDKPAESTAWTYAGNTAPPAANSLASSAATPALKEAESTVVRDLSSAQPRDPVLARRYELASRSAVGGLTPQARTRGLAYDSSSAKPPASEPGVLRAQGDQLAGRADLQEVDRFAESEGKRVLLGRGVQQAPAESTLRENLSRDKVVELQQLSDQANAQTSLYYRAPSGPVGGLAGAGAEAYAVINDNPFKDVTSAPLSTFGMDVDTGSYANLRRFLRGGSLPPPDAVRLEELINYFHYDYPQPRGDDPFSATVEIATCPWDETHKLARVGIRAKDIAKGERPRANLVFLLDVSGSMEPENKLPLVKRSMRLLLDRLTSRDTVGIVTYAGDAKVALEPIAITPDGKQRVTDVLEGLRAGSGTHGSAGIQNAYAMATNHFVKEGVNRVILCTDGDFNIGITDRGELLNLITQEAKSGVFLSVLGFGMDNLKDVTMETLADKGNGNYAYIDSFSEARKVLVEQLDGTLVTVAKDAKIQVEFNPARVASYRLLGYEKRLLRDRDFNDDTKDAGEVGAGHSVTVLYEIVPTTPNLAGVDPLRYGEKTTAPGGNLEPLKPVHTDEILNLKLRYKQPDGEKSRLIEQPVKDGDHEFAQAGSDFKFAAAVAGYGMLLRSSPHKGDLTWEKVLRLAEQGLGDDKEGYRAEFVDLARTAQKLGGGK